MVNKFASSTVILLILRQPDNSVPDAIGKRPPNFNNSRQLSVKLADRGLNCSASSSAFRVAKLVNFGSLDVVSGCAGVVRVLYRPLRNTRVVSNL